MKNLVSAFLCTVQFYSNTLFKNLVLKFALLFPQTFEEQQSIWKGIKDIEFTDIFRVEKSSLVFVIDAFKIKAHKNDKSTIQVM